MKLLVDNALSHHLARLLREAGVDAIHLRERIAVDSPDHEVFELAKNEGRILLSADTDFGVLLANREDSQPSFILLRHDTPAIPEAQADLVLKILAQTKADLERGCIVSASRNHVRVRSLPLR